MSIKARTYGLLFFMLIGLGGRGQSTYQAGLLPAINFNYKLPQSWSVNFKIESRQLYKTGTFGGEADHTYEYVLTDYALLAAKKVGLNARLAGGYQLRSRDGVVIHRFIQQLAIVERKQGFRLAHRVVFDQTLSSIAPTEYRLRYRLGAEIPLNGESADAREFYLKVNNEYLNALQGDAYDLEIRLVPVLGYIITPRHKVELGIDYRTNSFIDDTAHHIFYTSANWYIEL